MTEQKGTELVPSRELDAAVARALGHEVRQDDYGRFNILHPITQHGPVNLARAPFDPVPAYSSDMGACWREVVPELVRMGFLPVIECDSDGWFIDLKHGAQIDSFYSSLAHDQLPAAICRALLKVKKLDKKEKYDGS